jgi:hypothetical protein
MSDEEFLARWSRRKQEASARQAAPQVERDADLQAGARSPDAPQKAEHLEPDLSSLPPIEAIDATTDITAFLRKGIPPELTLAALRHAWSADPAIRDFVGLAENAWDFNDPNAMPGFGPLDYSPEQVEELVRRVVGGVRRAAECLPDALTEGAMPTERPPSFGNPSTRAPALPGRVPHRPLPDETICCEPSSAPAALQPLNVTPAKPQDLPMRRRTHGGALPQLDDQRP